MKSNSRKVDVGVDSVVIGRVAGAVGDRSVVIGATDDYGNVILNTSMAVGYNAFASPGSIAIGANARAGSELSSALAEVARIVEMRGDHQLKRAFGELCVEVERSQKNWTRIRQLWETLKVSAVLNDALGFVSRINDLIRAAGA